MCSELRIFNIKDIAFKCNIKKKNYEDTHIYFFDKIYFILFLRERDRKISIIQRKYLTFKNAHFKHIYLLR